MRNKKLLMLLIVGLVVSSMSVVWAQSSAPFGEVIDVHLVTMEVAVETFFTREPITDLEREDFSVFEDGEPRTITHFERVRDGVIDLAQGPTGEVLISSSVADSTLAEAPPRHVALAFDFGTLRRPYLERTVKAAKKFIRNDPDPRVEYSVMILGRRPDVLLPFTTNRDRAEAALDSLGSLLNGELKRAQGLAFGAPERFLSAAIEGSGAAGLQSQAGVWGSPLNQFLESVESGTCFWRTVAFSKVLAEAFQGWPGGSASKSMILFYEPDGVLCKPESVERGNLGLRSRAGQVVDEISRLAVASGIKVYATQATGLENPSVREAAIRGRIPTVGSSPPAYLASLAREVSVDQVTDRTGGRHINVNDLSRGLEMAATTSSNHYRISFQVARAPDGETHAIDINVDHPGKVTVRFPRTYDDVDSRTRLEGQLRTSANIPKRGGSLPVVVEAALHLGSAESDLVPVRASITVPIDELGLRWSPEEERPEVELFVALYAENGDLLEMQSEPWTPEASGEEGTLFQLFNMELPVANYTVVLAALDLVSGRYGLDFTELRP